MSTRILTSGLAALCLLGGCDGAAAPRNRLMTGEPVQPVPQVPREASESDRLSRLSFEDALEEVQYLGAVEGSAVRYGGECACEGV